MKFAVSATSKIPSETANSIQVLMACQGLIDAGQELTLSFPGQSEPDFDSIRAQYGLHCAAFPLRAVRTIPEMRRLDFCAKTLYMSSRERPDAYYTWTLQLAALAANLPLGSRPILYEAHDMPTGRFGERWAERFVAAKRPKRLIFITAALEERFRARFPKLAADESVVAPNGINLSDYTALPSAAEAKERLGLPSDRAVISCSGHLYAGRGVGLFLDLADDFPNQAFYWFGGTAESVSAYRSEAERRGLANVVFTGMIPKRELPLYQAASDILLMPYERSIAGSGGGDSAAICSPMKMFEYMAAQRPILSSDLAVIHEVLSDRTALFCEPESRDAWRAGIARILDDAAFGERIAAAAFSDAAQYSWKARAERILASFA